MRMAGESICLPIVAMATAVRLDTHIFDLHCQRLVALIPSVKCLIYCFMIKSHFKTFHDRY